MQWLWKGVSSQQMVLFSTSTFACFQFYSLKELLQSFEVIKQTKNF